MDMKESRALFQRAQERIPGGVNSPVRACRAVGADPLFIKRAEGCLLFDADGNELVDYIGSWGPMILGHRHPSVMEAVADALRRSLSFGAPTDLEVELAETVAAAVPSMEMVRMVNSGTEATMSAIRLARGVTGRDKIVKFDGCYHGHADSLLVEAGSGVATFNIPGSPGVPGSFTASTLSLPYNDIDAFQAVMEREGERIACVIVEPVAGNMGLVRPGEGFLQALRDLTQQHGSLLIFDEVMTGFRVAYGGAQELYGIRPDLTCLGKIIGGGMPVGAYGGRRETMSRVAPQGPVYQAGTLSGNPVAMAAGLATLRELRQPGVYDRLARTSERILSGLKAAADEAGVPVWADREGSMLGFFFTDRRVANFQDAKTADLDRFARFYRHMREKGIFLPPSQFEAWFVSLAHGDAQIDRTLQAAREALAAL